MMMMMMLMLMLLMLLLLLMMMMMMMRMPADLRMVLMRLVWVSHQALFCWVYR